MKKISVTKNGKKYFSFAQLASVKTHHLSCWFSNLVYKFLMSNVMNHVVSVYSKLPNPAIFVQVTINRYTFQG
jgi:hypothetical protein